MDTIIRKFNEEGIQQFQALLAKFRATKQIDHDALSKIVFESEYSEIIDGASPLTLGEQNHKYTTVKAICTSLRLSENRDLDKDRGLWTWLTAVMFQKAVQTNITTGEAILKEDDALYLYDPSWNRYYRHLLAFPCLVYSSLGDKGRIFLRGPVYERGEIVEQLASVQDVQRNPGIIEAISVLYYNSESDDVIRGAASKPNEARKLGGQARRLREVLKQFALTYDLNAMNGQQIVELLPKEFDRWKRHQNEPEITSAI